VPALPGPDRGGGPCILGNVKWWSGSTLLDYGRKVNKLTASEVLVQVKKLVDSGKWDKKKKRSRFSPCLLYFFCVCIYYRGGVGWGGVGATYVHIRSLPCCLRIHTRRERQRGRAIDS